MMTASALILLFTGWVYLSELIEVDSCLDRGGSFNYGEMKCDFENNHEYIPFHQRHAGLLLLALIGFSTATTIIVKKPNQRVDPTVKTPVESGKVQGTAGHP